MNAESRLDARLRATLEQQAVGVDDIDTPPALLKVVDRSARRTRRTRIASAMGGALVAAAAAVVLTVLGPTGPPAPPEPATPPSPTGTWQRSLTGAGIWSGDWSLTFSRGTVLELTTPGGLSPDEGSAEGASYAVRGDILQLDAFANGACLEQPAGVYRWTVDGDRLFLEAADDPCQERRRVFAGVWSPGL
jgi:hypothetical protein